MATVYLALGSNLSNREENIKEAVRLLNKHHVTVTHKATVIETDPVGGPSQGQFLNTVIKAQTDLSPEDLLQTAKKIEKKLGRVKTVRNGPRTMDIDILLYDKLTLDTPELTIPHPRMLERSFVMAPLKEIAPEVVEELLHAHH